MGSGEFAGYLRQRVRAEEEDLGFFEAPVVCLRCWGIEGPLRYISFLSFGRHDFSQGQIPFWRKMLVHFPKKLPTQRGMSARRDVLLCKHAAMA